MGNVLNLGNVQAILRSSDSLFAKNLLLSDQNDLFSNVKTSATAGSTAASVIGGNTSTCNTVSFKNELERQALQQSYEDRLNAEKQNSVSTVLVASKNSAAVGSAFYYASKNGVKNTDTADRKESLKGKKLLSLRSDSTVHNSSDEFAPGQHSESSCHTDTDPDIIEQELRELFLNSGISASSSIFENDSSLDDTPIFFASEYSHSVSASVAKLVDDMVDNLLSYHSTHLGNALGMLSAVSELMNAAKECSVTTAAGITSVLQSSDTADCQYNPKAVMLPLYILGCSLTDYIRRYNCKTFNYKKERQKAEEKIARNEKRQKQRMAEFAAEFQFKYS